MLITLCSLLYGDFTIITCCLLQVHRDNVDYIMLIALCWLLYGDYTIKTCCFFTGASRLRPCGLHHVDCVMLINLLWLHYHYMWFIIGATRLWDHVDSDGAPRGLWVWQWLGGRGRGSDRHPPQHVCPHHEVSAIVHKIL